MGAGFTEAHSPRLTLTVLFHISILIPHCHNIHMTSVIKYPKLSNNSNVTFISLKLHTKPIGPKIMAFV